MSDRAAFSSFVMIGGFSAGVNFLARFPLDWLLGFEVAVVLAYLIAMTTAFLLNRRYAFKAVHGSWARQYARFTMVNVAALAQVFVVSVGLARFLFPAIDFTWNSEPIAHAIGLVSPIFTSYWGHKHYSFVGAAPNGTSRRI